MKKRIFSDVLTGDFYDYYIENVATCGVVILKFEHSNTFTINKGGILKTIFPRDFK